jgi:2-oxoacid:acceptor oxidoreductase gamma subunit (pyruvate/2-ketoisovalerate family)
MIEIRFHGRGGQGAVTAAYLLAKAAGLDGKHTQAFPAFGVERRGAPVKSFCRISEKPITLRSHVYSPDYIIVLDPTLMDLPEITEGLNATSVAVVNTKEPQTLKQKTFSYDATSLALEVLGKNIVNTAMLGVFSKATGLVSIKSVEKTLEEEFPPKLAGLNRALARKAYNKTKK